MIEHYRAVNDLAGILAVDGLDAILIGPYDLSASINRTAEFEHPEFEALMGRIKDACTRAGTACGVHVVAPSPEELSRRQAAGFRFLAYSIDSVILNHGAVRPQI
jgi:2-dehydro-3-deoxyglucarate aldolase